MAAPAVTRSELDPGCSPRTSSHRGLGWRHAQPVGPARGQRPPATPTATPWSSATAALTYAQVNAAANQVANLLVATRHRPRRQGRARPARTCRTSRSSTTGSSRPARSWCRSTCCSRRREIAYHLADSGREGVLLLPGHARAADGRGGVRGLRGHRRLRALLPDHGRPGAPRRRSRAPRRSAGAEDQPPTFETVVTDETDTAVILYTSGTTGQPKGAELSPQQHA